ncbi:TlpA family protein disulfide reductase [Tenacibaculum retecalamus]|uniref:TlpA family protein disulfide reductase n=1 Tax=Tenacibaculum retecalamus TaxID=3018315 RepID=UPI0023D95DAE|nr:thioredoxin-like domain-containing protein [Tenacibaculum retecalamus]WBX71835.1 thioredoxin-like domain-containing protein [Tenacibaculum retecalamus]
MRVFLFLIALLTLSSCAVFQPTSFTNDALDEKLVTIDRDSITLRTILVNNKGTKQFVQVFATYCPVSQDSFDDVIAFQKKNPSIKYVFLSVDHSYFDWKRGLENIKVKGQHYYIPKKGKGKLGAFLKLKTIPRFMILSKKGEIELFKSSSVSNKINNKIK